MGRLSRLLSRLKSGANSSENALPSRSQSAEPEQSASLTLGTVTASQRPSSTALITKTPSAEALRPLPSAQPRSDHPQSLQGETLAGNPTNQAPQADSKKPAAPTANAALAKAIAKHVENISENERQAFLNAELTDQNILQKIRAHDEDHAESSQLRKASSKLEKALQMLNRFSNIISAATSGNPEATLVIGAVRAVFDVALGFLAFFSKLSDMISRLSDFMEPLNGYASIPEHHTALQDAVAGAYGDIIRFCQKAHGIFVDERGRRRTMPAFRVMWRTQWLPFEAEFGIIEADLQHHLKVLQHSSAALTTATALDIQSTQKIQMKEDLLNWLSSFRYEERHEKRFYQRHPGTADWLLNTDEFLDWFEASDSNVLWCYGGPGMGKSFLAANVLEFITSERALVENVGIGFIYFDHQASAQQNLEHVICALLKQLCRMCNTMPEHLVLAKQRSLPVGSLEDFIKVGESFKELFLVVDALDECASSNRPDVIGFIQEVTKRLPHAKFYVTSRPEIDIARVMESSGTPTLEIDVSSVAPDIEKYVSDEVHDLRLGRNGVQLCVSSDELAAEIVHSLTTKAYGMFLWVRLQLENLCRVSECRRDSVVRAALVTLPEGLEATYSRMAQQIEAKPDYLRSLAIKCLKWVFYSERPLYVEELLFALTTFDDDTNAQDFELDDVDVVSGACANLIVLESAGEYGSWAMVRPAHYSVQEYFTTHKLASSSVLAPHLLDQSKLHAELASICMAHLKQPMMYFGDFGVPGSSLCLTQDPFLQYAACYFDSHMVRSVDLPDTQIRDLLESDPKLLHSVLITRAMDLSSWLSGYLSPPAYNVMHFWEEFKEAAIHSDWGAAVMVHGTHLSQLPHIRERYGTPEAATQALDYACRTLDHQLVLRLLNDGADPNVRLPREGTVLHVALRSCHRGITELLMERGAHVNADDDYGTSVLQAAAMLAQSETVQKLLERGADVNARGGPWGNALYAAASKEHSENQTLIAELLVRHGADLNARVGHCGTALAAAASTGQEEVVKLLLSHGADVNVEDDEMLPSFVPSNDREPSPRREENCKPGPVHVSPLYHACLNGYLDIAEALLDHGADPNREEGRYGNAMSEALQFADNPWIVALLIQRGFHVDIDTLTTAASRGHKSSLVEILSPDNGGPEFSDIDIGVALVAVWRAEKWGEDAEESDIDADKKERYVEEPDTDIDASDVASDESDVRVNESGHVNKSNTSVDRLDVHANQSDVHIDDAIIHEDELDFSDDELDVNVDEPEHDTKKINRKAVVDMLKMRLRFNVELGPDDAIDHDLDTFFKDDQSIIFYVEDYESRFSIVSEKEGQQSQRDSLVDDLEDHQVGDYTSTDPTPKSVDRDDDLRVAQVQFMTESCKDRWWYSWLLDEEARFL